MVSDEELRAAEAALTAIPEYQWLISSEKQWWTVTEVADNLNVGKDVVRSWCERGDIEGAVRYAAQVGWRLPRSGLIVFCARQQGKSQGQTAG